MNILFFILAFAAIGLVSLVSKSSKPTLKSNVGIPALGNNPHGRQQGRPALGNTGVDNINISVTGRNEVAEIRGLLANHVDEITTTTAQTIPLHIGELVRELPLLEDDPNYVFNFKKNAAGARVVANECLLEETHAFVVTGLKMSIVKQTGVSYNHTSTDYTESDVNCRRDFTSPDRAYFSEPGEAQALESIYNTYLKIEVDGNTTIPKLPTSMLRHQSATTYSVVPEKVIDSVDEDGTITYRTVDTPIFPETSCYEGYCKLPKGQRFVVDGNKDITMSMSLLEGSKEDIVGKYDENGIQCFNKVRLSLCGYFIDKKKAGLVGAVCSTTGSTF